MELPHRTILIPLLLFFFAFITNILPGQNLDQTISLHVRNKPISSVLKQISKISPIEFSYSPQSVAVDKRISVNIRNKPLREVLDIVLSPYGIDYMIVENHVVLKPKSVRETKNENRSTTDARHFTLSGFLLDKNTGEALIGANVYIKGSTIGAMTNGYGFFSLTLKEGVYPVVFSYLGYRSVEREINIDQPARLNIELEDGQLEIGEVEILATDQPSVVASRQMSDITFSQKTLQRLPGFGGDLDIIRALQAVPGIQSFGDGSSLYYVRGGNSDQNLLLIDEVPVYNPSHLFGFFSAFSPDAINSVQVYKGDFPAKYGGRLSSVIDIKAREGNMKHFGISGNVGPYASNFTFEGPIVKNRSSFILSGRVSTLNWLNNLSIFNKSFGFQFFDINGKLNFILDNNNRLFFTFYYGLDDFSRYNSNEVNSLGIGWNNLAGTVRWNHIFTNRLFSNTTLNISRYNYSLNLPQEQNGFWRSSIANLTLKTDGTWYLNPHNTIRSGIEVTYHASDPGSVTLQDGNTPQAVPVVAEYHSMEYLLYLSNEQQIGKKFSLRYGIRLPVWQDIGPTNVCYFDANHQVIDTIAYGNGESYSTTFSPEPRLNIQYQWTESSSVKASYIRTTQFLQLLSNSTSPFTSLEVWAPCGPNIPPQTADQVAVGYFRELAKKQFTFSAEAYYKWFHDRLDYRDHANLLFNTLIEGELLFGKGWSYGIELMLRKVTGNFTGWIGYTWSRAYAQTPGINNGAVYPVSYDRPNNFCVNLSWDDKKHWLLAANWIFMTGGAITSPVGFYALNGNTVPVYGEKNNDRLPDYHRLDLSATYNFSKPGNRFRHCLVVTIYNVYGRFNPFSVSYNKIMNDNGEFVVPSNMSGSYERIPTTISVAGMIPSINYQFRF